MAVFGLPSLSLLPIASGLALPLSALGWIIAVSLTALVVWTSLSIGARGLARIEL
jgi:hypothetical protein